MNRRIVMLGLIATTAGTCRPLPPGVRAPTEIWAIWAPGTRPVRAPDGFAAMAETWIALDSISFRPIVISRSAAETTPPDRPAAASLVQPRSASVITSYQGSRYHADVIRGLNENSDAARDRRGIDSVSVDFIRRAGGDSRFSGDERGGFADIDGRLSRNRRFFAGSLGGADHHDDSCSGQCRLPRENPQPRRRSAARQAFP